MPTLTPPRAARAARPFRAGRLALLAPLAAGLVAAAGPVGCKNKSKPAATQPDLAASTQPAGEAAAPPSPFPHGGVMANDTNKAFVPKPTHGTLGTIDRLDPALDALLPPDAAVEKLVEGLDWAEGPVYDKAGGRLFFSDVPQNVVYVWKDGQGLAEYFRPSGYTGTTPRGGEPGSNGLTLDNLGRLVLAQHGDRCVARLQGFQPESATNVWRPVFVPLVSKYNGKRFNSPNDLCFDSRGNLYFTDPPYGLVGNVDDPAKEVPNQGVYRLSNKGELTLLTGGMTRPNGIALSPDERTLYVANSDPDKAIWMAYPIDPAGKLGEGKVFFDATAMAKDQDANKGLPDGLKVDTQGNLWATGPGGVLIFSAAGKHLGTLRTGEATANVAWGGEDGSTLFVCADSYVARVKTTAKGW
jgi:gluconolactonase